MKERYHGMPCWLIVLVTFRDTRQEWSYEELRYMTGYSIFSLSAAIGYLKKQRCIVTKTWDPDDRTNYYRVIVNRPIYHKGIKY